jgi:hypothetical protein
MALSADTVRMWRETPTTRDMGLPAYAATFYRGACLEDTSGYVAPASGTGTFRGFLMGEGQVVATSGDSDLQVRVDGEVKLTVVGASAVSDEDSDVYATDDGTFTLTSSGGMAIGTVVEWVSGTTCWVRIQAASQRSI